MELAGLLGHSPHYVTLLENTDVYEYSFSNVLGVANDVSSNMSSFANRTGRINCISFLSISQYSLNLILHFHFFLALGAMVQVVDRPVTRQGLGGIRTQSQGCKHCFVSFFQF